MSTGLLGAGSLDKAGGVGRAAARRSTNGYQQLLRRLSSILVLRTLLDPVASRISRSRVIPGPGLPTATLGVGNDSAQWRHAAYYNAPMDCGPAVSKYRTEYIYKCQYR